MSWSRLRLLSLHFTHSDENSLLIYWSILRKISSLLNRIIGGEHSYARRSSVTNISNRASFP